MTGSTAASADRAHVDESAAPARTLPAHETQALVAELIERRLSIAVAESLTGGALTAELVTVPGVSQVLRGGVVSYDERIKQRVLGVEGALLREHGPVHPEVALQMARGVREVCAVDGGLEGPVPARLGLATTGVAGPGAADGHEAGEVFIAVVLDGVERVRHLRLTGDRAAVRAAAVRAAISLAHETLAELRGPRDAAGVSVEAVPAFKANSKALDAGPEAAAR